MHYKMKLKRRDVLLSFFCYRALLKFFSATWIYFFTLLFSCFFLYRYYISREKKIFFPFTMSFNIDQETSFPEYLARISRHADVYQPPSEDLATLARIATALVAESKRCNSKGEYDNSFYYALKCLKLFDRDVTTVDLRNYNSDMRTVLKTALGLSEQLVAGSLKDYYDSQINEMRLREPERQKILAQQLEQDTFSVPPLNTVDAGHLAHDTRRQRLLSSGDNNAEKLRLALNTITVPGSKVKPLDPTAVPPPTYIPVDSTKHSFTRDLPSLTTSQNVESLRRVVSKSSIDKPCVLNLGRHGPTVPRRGIVNLGNTCYMNSVLQVLNSTPLSRYFLTDDYMNHLVSTGGASTRLINSFCSTLRELNWTDCRYSVSASSLKKAVGEYAPAFDNFQQQDANEFLRVLLDGLHIALNGNGDNNIVFPEINNSVGTDEELSRKYWAQYYQKNASVIVDSCAFQERSMIFCPNCNNTSRSFNPTLSIEVPIPTTVSKATIEDCLSLYCREETLGNDSLYHCSNCSERVRAKKQLLLYSVPSILFISLKRFRLYGDFSSTSKVNSDVFFSETLDLSPYMCSSFPKSKFRLVGIVNHQGNMHGGHYTADTVGPDGVWCHFSDEAVSTVDVADSKLAYILCYVRQ